MKTKFANFLTHFLRSVNDGKKITPIMANKTQSRKIVIAYTPKIFDLNLNLLVVIFDPYSVKQEL
tara:strand:+ start:894 stop:1088 length:195 start_codon:yes stop_codon:yes gene_type:complete